MNADSRLLNRPEFEGLAAMPAELEWLANIESEPPEALRGSGRRHRFGMPKSVGSTPEEVGARGKGNNLPRPRRKR